MIRLQNQFFGDCDVVDCLCGLACGLYSSMRRLRLAVVWQLTCVAASGLLLGGCVSSSNSRQTGSVEGGTPTPSPARGDIPNVGNPAGIQLYAQTKDGILLLVADHAYPSKRGWAGFGGAADAGETIAQTAARETEEETRGYFKREDLLAAIAGQEPIFDGKFAFYFVKVDWVPAELIGSHPIGDDAVFAERGPYAWVPHAEIERCLKQQSARSPRNCVIDPRYLPTENLNTNWFWPVWLNNFRAAKFP